MVWKHEKFVETFPTSKEVPKISKEEESQIDIIPNIEIDQVNLEESVPNITKNTLILSNEQNIKVKVIFETEFNINQKSLPWIGIFRVRESDSSYLDYVSFQSEHTKDKKLYEIPFKLPRSSGYYGIRYFDGKNSYSTAKSKPILVSPFVKISFKDDPNDKTGQTHIVDFNQTFGLVHVNTAYILQSRSDGYWTDSQYVDRSSGQLKFKKPLVNGIFRYQFIWEGFLINSTEPFESKSSDSLTGEIDNLTLTMNVNLNWVSKDSAYFLPWIGLYYKNDPHTSYIDYRFVNKVGKTNYKFIIEKPKTSKEYELRLFDSSFVPDVGVPSVCSLPILLKVDETKVEQTTTTTTTTGSEKVEEKKVEEKKVEEKKPEENKNEPKKVVPRVLKKPDKN